MGNHWKILVKHLFLCRWYPCKWQLTSQSLILPLLILYFLLYHLILSLVLSLHPLLSLPSLLIFLCPTLLLFWPYYFLLLLPQSSLLFHRLSLIFLICASYVTTSSETTTDHATFELQFLERWCFCYCHGHVDCAAVCCSVPIFLWSSDLLPQILWMI